MTKLVVSTLALLGLVLSHVAKADEPPGFEGWKARATYTCSTISSNNDLTINLVANYKDWQDESAPPSRTIVRRFTVYGAGVGGNDGCKAQAALLEKRRDILQISELAVCYYESGVTFMGLLNLTPNGDIIVITDRNEIFRGGRTERFNACLEAAKKYNG